MWSWPLWFGLGWIQEVKRGRAKQQWQRDHWEDKFGVNDSWFCDEIKVSLSHQDTPLKHRQKGYFYLSFEPYRNVVTRRHLHSWQLNFFLHLRFRCPGVSVAKSSSIKSSVAKQSSVVKWTFANLNYSSTTEQLNFSTFELQLSKVQLPK